MRLESIPSPTPLILLNLCRQPASWSSAALDDFRDEVQERGILNGQELKYEGISLSTSGLSVYRGSHRYECALEEAYESVTERMDRMSARMLVL